MEVVRALAAVEDVDPAELEPPLHTILDPDALDAFFRDDQRAGAGTVQVTFEYLGREIRIEEPGEITVSNRLDEATSRRDHDRPR